MLCEVKRIRCLITKKKIQMKGRQLLITLSLICHASRIWVATSSGRSQDKDICVSSASDADQSKCYLNSPLRQYKVLHLEPMSTRCYLLRSVLRTKAKLRDAIFFPIFQFALSTEQEGAYFRWGGVWRNTCRNGTHHCVFSPVQLENWRRKSSHHKIIYTLMVRYTLLVIRSPLSGGGNPIMWATSQTSHQFKLQMKKIYANEMQDGHLA